MGLQVTGPKKFKVAFKVPTNDKRFWSAVGQEIATEIHKRTLSGLDENDRAFKPYTTTYAQKKAYGKVGKAGGGYHQPRGFGNVNLTLSGKMLKALAAGVRSGKDNAKITLSGNEGFKAWVTEKNGREWFGLSNRRLNKVFKKIDKWIQRKNKL